MKRNLYEVLGVDKKAPTALINQAFKVVLALHEERYHQGDMDAHGDIVIIKEAYNTLSNPEKRKAYDAEIERNSATTPAPVIPVYQTYADEPENIFMVWWYTSKTTMLLAGILALLAAYVGLGYFKTHIFENVSEKYIEVQAKTSNDIVDVAKQEEERRKTALALSQKNEQIRLEIQRQELEARLDAQRREQDYRQDMQRRQAADQENRREADLARQKERDANMYAERERRYYSCLNPAINRYGLERAQIMCASYH